MNFEEELRQSIDGEMRFDIISLKAYSVDASIYEIEPIGIVLPKHKQDIVNAVMIAKKHNIPVIARGAATGIAGGCIGNGLIIDLSKFLNRIIHVDSDYKYAICEPGVIQDQLNAQLAPHGYRLGPDTSTGNRATLGGMVANNAAGSRSLHYGKMVDTVLEVEIVLADGKIIKFGSVDEKILKEKCNQKDAEGYIYREVWRIREQYKHHISKRFPVIPRRVSGYNLDEIVKEKPNEKMNIAKLIVGSEGTLGIITEITVQLAKSPRVTGISIVHFHDLLDSMSHAPFFLTFKPMAIELIDNHIISMGRISPSLKDKVKWLEGEPQSIVILEFQGASKEEVAEKIELFHREIKQKRIGYAHKELTDPEEMEKVWALRKSGLGLLLAKRSYSRAVAFIEDISVGPEQLSSFMTQFIACLKKYNKEAGIYGHMGSGCMHIRPYIDLRKPEELATMQQLMIDVADLLIAYGGALSGEHGDGLARSWLNKKMFGELIYHAFIEIKKAFDPNNLMNPGKIVHPQPFLDHLRLSPEIAVKKNSIPTFLDFSKEGGFELAVDLCNGNGQCRKKEGVMCPSFQATEDEYDTTRARAQALRSLINGGLGSEEFLGQGIHDVLDLCLQCKGCKTECPSQVDMAKMKTEFLYHYQEKHGYQWRSKIFTRLGTMNRIGSLFPKIYNWLQKSRFAKWILEKMGITTERPLPRLAKRRFSKWWKEKVKAKTYKKKIVLFNDTYTEFQHPEIGKAAVKILEALGYEIIVPQWHCCGRLHLSKGILPTAKQLAEKVVETLYPYALEGIPIVGLEPSCLFTIQDDYHGLLGFAHDKLSKVLEHCSTLDKFLSQLRNRGELTLSFNPSAHPVPVIIHGHCYEKALAGLKDLRNILEAVPHFKVSEIPSGCCGLAGSFGYEKEHYDLSMKIGELKLFPAVRQATEIDIIVANGVSCRSQIHHGTEKQAVHFAKIFAANIKN